MILPTTPPLVPMLARLSRELPADGYLYEPKWDGFRCLAFCDHGRVELRSRHDRPLTRYFPEIEQALRSQVQTGTVLDGELVATRAGKLDFSARLPRLHPAASRVQRLRIDPATDELVVAQRWLAEQPGGGIDGVIAKRRRLTYRPGARAMVKVKREQTADCDLRGHPWQRGFLLAGGPTGRLAGAAARWSAEEMELDWIPVSPTLVCEVAYDQVDVDRFRHPARFRRWRPDREPRSCRLWQLEVPERDPLEVLAQA